jgi:hypothetical protein
MSIKNTRTELLTNVLSLSFCVTQELITSEHLCYLVGHNLFRIESHDTDPLSPAGQLESGGVRHTLQLVVREEVSTSS